MVDLRAAGFETRQLRVDGGPPAHIRLEDFGPAIEVTLAVLNELGD